VSGDATATPVVPVLRVLGAREQDQPGIGPRTRAAPTGSRNAHLFSAPFRAAGAERTLGTESEGAAMQAAVGERLVIHSKTVGQPDRHGEVLEVRGEGGAPPYLVRFDDGHETLLYPGADCELEHAAR
jgi:hypothetical protein